MNVPIDYMKMADCHYERETKERLERESDREILEEGAR